MQEYAGIHILKSPYHIDSAFDYFIPPEIRGNIAVGDFAVVPFGNSNKSEIGLVVSIKDSPEKRGQECKPVLSVYDKAMSLGEEALGLCFFMKEQTLCTVGDAVRAIVPTSVLTKLIECYTISDTAADPDTLNTQLDAIANDSARSVCEFIRKRGSADFDLLKETFGAEIRGTLKKLCDKGIITRGFELKNTSDKTESIYSLAIEPRIALRIAQGIDSDVKLRSDAQKYILSFLCDNECEEITRQR
jgi:primosomal protein N'